MPLKVLLYQIQTSQNLDFSAKFHYLCIHCTMLHIYISTFFLFYFPSIGCLASFLNLLENSSILFPLFFSALNVLIFN